ncbi:MAG: hypothetical protein DBY17_00010 [Oscillospiraceae bacterium]|nr:MAG: hypothetical protein DBY17_00010 [Oscillospiraceae bacterium]
MAGPPEGKTAQPLPEGRVDNTASGAATKPMLPLPAAPDTTEKNGPAPLYGGAGRDKAGRNLAARGTAFRPHRGFCPQSLWPSEKVALLCTQHSV